MKITITIDSETQKVLQKPVDELTADDNTVLDTAKSNLPRNVVKIPTDIPMIKSGDNAKPLEHIVKKGETLKSICDLYGISYEELNNYLMNKEGTTSIYEGQKLEIPRHFIDLTKAIK